MDREERDSRKKRQVAGLNRMSEVIREVKLYLTADHRLFQKVYRNAAERLGATKMGNEDGPEGGHYEFRQEFREVELRSAVRNAVQEICPDRLT